MRETEHTVLPSFIRHLKYSAEGNSMIDNCFIQRIDATGSAIHISKSGCNSRNQGGCLRCFRSSAKSPMKRCLDMRQKSTDLDSLTR